VLLILGREDLTHETHLLRCGQRDGTVPSGDGLDQSQSERVKRGDVDGDSRGTYLILDE
jgi:hypothetical protein